MTSLKDVVDLRDLEEEIQAGYVKCTAHPDYPYSILNYTDKAQFDNRWTDTVKNCRGLIYNVDTFEVIARGMPKFFNHNQPGAPEIGLDDIVHVADKADGSLGILYPTPDGRWAIATRGSFTSDQALHATERFEELGLEFVAEYGFTQVYEIIYPENRIVLNYGDRDELVLLGVVDNETGRFYPDTLEPGYEGTMTFGEALAQPPRVNAEGYVFTRVSDGAMAKYKYDAYLLLHKAIFGLSARKLWELLIVDADMDEYIASLPDELQAWAKETARSIEVLAESRTAWLAEEFNQLLSKVETDFGVESWDRGDFARYAKEHDEAWAMFALLDGKDLYPVVLKKSRPDAFITPVVHHGEDVS